MYIDVSNRKVAAQVEFPSSFIKNNKISSLVYLYSCECVHVWYSIFFFFFSHIMLLNIRFTLAALSILVSLRMSNELWFYPFCALLLLPLLCPAKSFRIAAIVKSHYIRYGLVLFFLPLLLNVPVLMCHIQEVYYWQLTIWATTTAEKAPATTIQ